MSLKTQLLQPMQLAPVAVTIFGGEYQVKRLSAGRLNAYDTAIKAHQAAQNGEKLNTESALLVLDSMLDENNQPMSDTVTPSELMAVHTPTAINAAVAKLINVNFLDADAESAAKKS